MIKHIFIFVFLCGFLLSNTACDNDDNIIPVKKDDPPKEEEEEPGEDIKDDSPLLPVFIKRTYVLNADPFHDNIDSVVFTYDHLNRLVRRSTTTSFIYHETKKEQVGYQSILNIVYNTNGTITTTDSLYYNYDKEKEVRLVNVRIYQPDTSQVHITLNDNLKESIELKKGRPVKYNKISLYPSAGSPYSYSTGKYSYNEKGNIITHADIPGIKYEQRFKYDNHNGIFKHLNMPPWLIVDILGIEHLRNNMTKQYSVFSGETMLSNYNEYKYNSNGYPVEINDRPAPDMIGYWGSRSIVEYIPAILLPLAE